MKNLLFLWVLIISINGYAQIDVLQVPTNQEKVEVQRIVGEYEKLMTANGDSALAKEKKALAVLKFSKEIINNDIQVYNDLDSIGEDKFLKIFTYIQKFKEAYPQTVTTKILDLNISNVKYDKIRRYYFIEASGKKLMQWKKLQRKTIVDSLRHRDTVITDTLKYSSVKNLTFYIRFDKDKTTGVAKNFKLYAIGKKGGLPKLEPLPEIMVWWLEMDLQWKSYFRESLKLDEYPTTYEIQRITGLSKLDISGKTFKTLAPLNKMAYLQELKCVNTPITSLNGISEVTSLLELDISDSKIENLSGIEKLTNLQELKCTGLKLKSIEPVKTLTSLIKFDCSNNELEDISPVSELVNLKELDFSSNVKLEDIKPIKKLILMEKLSFAKVKAGSLEPVRNMINLIHLNCYNTEVPTLEPIRNLQKIVFLNLDHNPVTTLEPIKGYRFVTDLSLATSSVTDLAPIKDFNFLRVLNVANTQITTLGPAIKLEYIRVLQCQMTKVPKEEVARFKKNHPGADITYYY